METDPYETTDLSGSLSPEIVKNYGELLTSIYDQLEKAKEDKEIDYTAVTSEAKEYWTSNDYFILPWALEAESATGYGAPQLCYTPKGITKKKLEY